MSEERRESSIHQYIVLFVAIWTVLILALFVWSYVREDQTAIESARISARAQFDKDVIYRHWNAGHGGVYVPVTELSPGNPHLTDRARRDVETLSGLKLTLINPAYMTRQVHELGYAREGMRGHITSLDPIRPENKADAWERVALSSFDKGDVEFSSIELLDSIEHMRLMKPLMTEQSCLACHAFQGYEVGDVRGGISVAVPMAPYLELMRAEIRSSGISLAGIWLLGVFAIAGAGWHVTKRIAEREQARLDLGRSQQQLQLVLHGSGLGSWDWNFERDELACNERWATMKGYELEEIKPQLKAWRGFIHPDDRSDVEDRWSAHLAGEAPEYESEFRIRSKSGEWVWILDRGKIIERNAVGQPVRACGTHLDITDRKHIELELQQAQKLESVGQLAAGIAHEINTPIQFIGDNLRFIDDVYADLIQLGSLLSKTVETRKERPLTNEEIEEAAQAVADADLVYLKEEIPQAIMQSLDGVQRVATIVQALKEFSHPGSGAKEPANLNEAIEMTMVISRNEWRHVADIETDYAESLPLIPCYVGEFNQVILNLIINARDAIEDRAKREGSAVNGKIRISTRLDEQWAIIEISDTGDGMNEKVRSRIFEPFYTTKEVGRGSGQGLAIARSVIVDKHDGRIDVQSEVGVGTCFTIKLPLT